MSTTQRARQLVASACTETVTEQLLIGGNEYTGEFILYDQPPIAHLEPDEQPHAILFNDLKGVGIDSKRNTVTPDGRARSVFIVTDRRLLLLVGQQDGDWVRSVSLDTVTGGAYHTGLMKHRVVVYTHEQSYHLWADAFYEERELASVVELFESAAETGDRPAVTGATDSGPEETPTAVGDGAGISSGTTAETTAGNDPLQTLERLKQLHDNGVLTDDEFQTKKSELLAQI